MGIVTKLKLSDRFNGKPPDKSVIDTELDTLKAEDAQAHKELMSRIKPIYNSAYDIFVIISRGGAEFKPDTLDKALQPFFEFLVTRGILIKLETEETPIVTGPEAHILAAEKQRADIKSPELDLLARELKYPELLDKKVLPKKNVERIEELLELIILRTDSVAGAIVDVGNAPAEYKMTRFVLNKDTTNSRPLEAGTIASQSYTFYAMVAGINEGISRESHAKEKKYLEYATLITKSGFTKVTFRTCLKERAEASKNVKPDQRKYRYVFALETPKEVKKEVILGWMEIKMPEIMQLLPE